MTTRKSVASKDEQTTDKPRSTRRGFAKGITSLRIQRTRKSTTAKPSSKAKTPTKTSTAKAKATRPTPAPKEVLTKEKEIIEQVAETEVEVLPPLAPSFEAPPTAPAKRRVSQRMSVEEHLRHVIESTPVIGAEPSATSTFTGDTVDNEIDDDIQIKSNELLDIANQQNKFATNNVVFKDNRLVNASYNLPVNHMRLILVAIAKAGNEPIRDKCFYRINAHDLIEAGVPKTSVSAVMRDAYDGLYKQSIDLIVKVAEDGSEEHVRLHWVDVVKYNPKNSYVDLCFGGLISKFISGLSQTFTAFKLSTIREIKSFNSIRIYEMISQFISTGRFIISIDDLLYRLQVKSRYEPCILRRRILDPAVKEIKNATNLSVSYELKATRGRKFDTIHFSWPVHQDKQLANESDDIIQLTPKQAFYFATLLHSDEAFRFDWGKGRRENWKKLLPVIEKELLDPTRMAYFLPWLKKYDFDPDFKTNIRRRKAKDTKAKPTAPEEQNLFDGFDIDPQDLH